MNKTRTLADELRNVSTVMYPIRHKIKTNRSFVDSLLHIFSKVKDFRQEGKVVYDLENILCICFLLALQGAFTSFHETANRLVYYKDYFINLGLLDKNTPTPSHDTLRRICMLLDANQLRDSLLLKLLRLVDKIIAQVACEDDEPKIRLLSGDGKTFRGSGRVDGERNINVFNFYDVSSAICLTSEPLDDKESEIPAFQRILSRYNLKNTMVTADALHCQRKTCEIIIKKGGFYCFKTKNNQKEFLAHMIYTIDKNKDKCHVFSHNNCDYEIFIIDYETTDMDFPGAKAYIRMRSHKRRDQKDYNPQPQYFVSSASNITLIAETIDNRWQIENGLHKFKDEYLHEDECTFRDKNCIKVMATFNNIAYAIFRLASAILDNGNMQFTKYRFHDDPAKVLAKIVPLFEKQNLTTLIKENMRGVVKKKMAKNKSE